MANARPLVATPLHRTLLASFVVGLWVTTALSAQTINLALGADTSESDSGWGGGSYPADMVEGQTYYTDTWAHGLAFTGGQQGWAGQPCGWRQATVDLGTPGSFGLVRVWHHGADHIPNTYGLEYWDGSNWLATGGSSTTRWDLEVPLPGVFGWGAIPTEHIFPEVESSKVRFRLNNCDITHGWIYEFEVFAPPLAFRLPFVGPYPISQGPGCPNGNHQGVQAQALDYGLPNDQLVVAAEGGTVVYADWFDATNHNRGFGKVVQVKHGDGSVSFYGHLSRIDVVAGNPVAKGEPLGRSGSTGNVNPSRRGGHHLHFEIRTGTTQHPSGYHSGGTGVSITALPGTSWTVPGNVCHGGWVTGPPAP